MRHFIPVRTASRSMIDEALRSSSVSPVSSVETLPTGERWAESDYDSDAAPIIVPRSRHGPEVVPRQIFTFWHDHQPPELVKACIALMRRRHPGWTVTVLDPSNSSLPQPPAGVRSLIAPALLSDWYRLAALAEHGGVWLDASCITLQPVTAWIDLTSTALQGFKSPGEGEAHMEGWAFGAVRGDAFVAAWRDEMGRALSMGLNDSNLPAAYCSQESVQQACPEALRSHLPYLCIHAAWCVVRRRMTEVELRLRSSIALGGPYHYLAANQWRTRAALLMLLSADASDEGLAKTSLIKLRSCERQRMPPIGSLAERGSHVARILGGALLFDTLDASRDESTD